MNETRKSIFRRWTNRLDTIFTFVSFGLMIFFVVPAGVAAVFIALTTHQEPTSDAVFGLLLLVGMWAWNLIKAIAPFIGVLALIGVIIAFVDIANERASDAAESRLRELERHLKELGGKVGQLERKLDRLEDARGD